MRTITSVLGLLIFQLWVIQSYAQELVSCEGETLFLSASGELLDWQWQQNIDGVWVDFEEQADVLGVDSSDLALVDLSVDQNGLDVRCLSTGILSGMQDSVVFGPASLVVNPILNPSSLSWSSSPQDPSCFNASLPLINQTNAASGGSGNYAYQWESFFDGMWNPLSNLDFSTLELGEITSAVQVRQSVVDMDGNCGPVYSNVLSVDVLPEFNSSNFEIALSGNSSICFETSPGSLNVLALPTGGANNYSYQWQMNNDGSWLDIPGADASDYQVPNLSISTSYRLRITDDCGEAISNEVFIEVYGELLAPEIDFVILENLPLCSENDGVSLEVTQNAGGGGELFDLQWYSRTSGGSWEALVGQDATSFNSTSLQESTDFYLLATSQFNCGTRESNEIEIAVYEALVLEGVGMSQTICNNAVFENLNAQGLSGGSGQYSFTWTSSSDGNNYALVPNEETSSLSGQALTSSQIYNLEVIDDEGCGTVSAEVAIEVLPVLLAPSIDYAMSSDPICYDTDAPTIEVTVPPSGADQMFTNSWQYQVLGDWIDVPAFDGSLNIGLSDELGSLIENHDVRLVSTSTFGCGVINSNELTIEVYEELNVGSSSVDQLLCFNSSPSDLNVAASMGGGDVFQYGWFELVGMSWEPIMGENELLFNPGNLQDSVQYRVEALNLNGCGTLVYEEIHINVLPELPNVMITGNPEEALCFSSSLNLSAVNLIDYPFYSYSWILDEGNGPGPISNESGLDLTFTNLEAGIYDLEFQVLSDFNCGQSNSQAIQFEVLPALTEPQIVFQDENLPTLCFGDMSPILILSQEATGSLGSFSYSWQTSMGGLNDNYIFNDFADNLFITLEDTLSINLLATDDYGCGSVLSNQIVVNVYPELTLTSFSVPDTICYTSVPESELLVTGGNNNFQYQWFSSFDGVNFQQLNNEIGNTMTQSSWTEDVFIYAIANSDVGCGVIEAPSSFITVLDELSPGDISVSSIELCEGEEINYSATAPSGGYGDFNEVWHYSSTGDTFIDEVENDEVGQWTVIAENEASYVYVAFESTCGVVQTDTVFTLVNPLPIDPIIIGEFTPCPNSVNQLYEISNWEQDVEYQWSVSSFGGISSGESTPSILVDWSDVQGSAGLSVIATNILTGCTKLVSEGIDFTNVPSPPVSEVVKKPLINILVSGDSTLCATYQWGQIEIATGELEYLDGYDEQYAFIEDLNPDLYYYFVDVSYDCGDGEISCPTRNYYNYDPFIGVQEQLSDFLQMYPNPSNGRVNLSFNDKIHLLEVFSLEGECLKSIQPGNKTNSIELHVDLPNGVYFVRINGRTARKLIIVN